LKKKSKKVAPTEGGLETNNVKKKMAPTGKEGCDEQTALSLTREGCKRRCPKKERVLSSQILTGKKRPGSHEWKGSAGGPGADDYGKSHFGLGKKEGLPRVKPYCEGKKKKGGREKNARKKSHGRKKPQKRKA